MSETQATVEMPDVRKMDCDAIRVELAEHRGWTQIHYQNMHGWFGVKPATPQNVFTDFSDIPYWTLDAGDCYELEREVLAAGLAIDMYSSGKITSGPGVYTARLHWYASKYFRGSDYNSRLLAFCRAVILAYRGGALESKRGVK